MIETPNFVLFVSFDGENIFTVNSEEPQFKREATLLTGVLKWT